MKAANRYKSKFWYLPYKGSVPIEDEYGNETGTQVQYGAATVMYANVSAAAGSAQVEQFGSLAGYDKVILTDEIDCPIDENTVLFLDKAPEYDKGGNPLYDYRVKRVAKSKGIISYAVSKVSVS